MAETRQGAVCKAREAGEVTDAQLRAINGYTRRPLEKSEVFVFPAILCDSEIDRDWEQFPKESLEKLAALYQGKTGVFDHKPDAAHQSARIFGAEVVRGEGANAAGEDLWQLKAWAYMVRCAKNDDLILEIDAGIKKEVSVGCAVEKALCSICGADQKRGVCAHEKGRTYEGRLCFHRLVRPTDAYEWSFVAVPAQKGAGVIKHRDAAGPEGAVPLDKLFSGGGDVLVSADRAGALSAELEDLRRQAALGAEYGRHLRKEAVRVALLSHPDLDPALMERLAERLDPGELRALAKAFGRTAQKALPVRLQLAGSGGRDDAADGAFKI